MTSYKLLDHEQVGILEIFVNCRDSLLNFLQDVDSDVLVAICLEDFTSDFLPLEAIGVNEVAVFTTGAPVWPMVIATRHSPEIARLDQNIRIDDDLLVSHLLLHLSSLFLLVDFFELADRIVGEADQHVR